MLAAAFPHGIPMLHLDRSRNLLLRGGMTFDPWALAWAGRAPEGAGGEPVTPVQALAWLYAQPRVRRVPVAVIGPKNAKPAHLATAEALGRRLGELRVPMITGGRGGVMEAASRGCLEAGGQPIGILPGEEWEEANPYVVVPLATGMGPARNAVIARAAFALIAVGGEYGTLSEMAFGLHFNRLVVALEDAPDVPGALRYDNPEAALEAVAARLLRLEASA